MTRPTSRFDRQATTWKPVMLDPRTVSGRVEIARLGRRPEVRLCDRLREQLAELVRADRPNQQMTASAEDAVIAEHLHGAGLQDYGYWFFYPWSSTLVHVLPEHEFRRLRSDRNRLKILPAEQQRLATARIAIAGLSVGLAAATTLALEGVGGAFALADFDALGLSNLNRLNAPVADLGLNKAVLAARRLLELDPYLRVEVFDDGVTDANIDAFLGGGMPGPALLVEECDDLYMKIRLRERARDLRLPVLMETSDGGMLDVERFDLEPERDLLHGLVPGVNAAALRGMATKDKVPIVLRILGQDHLSARTAASLVEIGQTLSTWPQLASAVALGGSLVADAARRVLLGTLNQSGRVRVDVGRLVTDCTLIGNAGQSSHTESEASVMEMADAVVDARPLGTEDERGIDDSVRYLVAQACLAPSGGNCQPWRFVADGPAVDCYIDVGRSESRLNVGHLGSYVAMGAAVENMVLSAEARGVALKVEINTSASLDEPVFRATVGGPVAPSPSRLFEQIGYRCTNRHRGVRDRLHVGQRIALEREARGGRVLWFESQEELERLGMLHGRADRLRFLSKQMHRELIAEVRWTPAEAEHSRDGLDLRSLELSAADQAALNLLKQWPTLSVLKQTDGGRALEDMTRRMFLASSAIAVLQVPGRTPLDYLEGGRILQRVWLAATGEGVAVHPQGALVYSLARLEREPESLSADVRDELTRVRDEYRELVPANGGADVLMLRLSVAPEPSVRSLRRPLGSVLSAAPDARLARARSVQVPPGSRT